MDIYGVVDAAGVHHDASRSKLGAKIYATRNGYKTISRRNADHYHAVIVSEKINGKWQDR